MKFIINGRTFDTATSTTVAVDRGINMPDYNNLPGDAEVRYENTLFRTTKGAFFVHEHSTEKLVKGGRPIVSDLAFAVSPHSAIEWIVNNQAMVLDDAGLPMPPEADPQEGSLDVGSFRDDLVLKVENAAAWRANKAKEFPEDARNQVAADALKNIAEELRTVPAKGRLLGLHGLWIIGGSTDQLAEMVEAESEFINRYGFDSDVGNVHTFLAGLYQAIDTVMR